MTDKEWSSFLIQANTHTAFGRLAHAEVQAAFEKLAELGYSVVKTEPKAK